MAKINNKQFLLITVIWFLIAYIIMWVLSGACTSIFVAPSVENSVCLTKEAVSGLSQIPLLGFILPFTPWVSFFYWFSPVAGFIFGYFVIKWWNNYFETKEATTVIFPILMILFLIIGFVINLGWFYGEIAHINSVRNPGLDVALYFCFDQDPGVCNSTVNRLNIEFQEQARAGNVSSITQFIGVNFWQELKSNIFLTFIIGSIFAWKLLFVRKFFEGKK